MGVVSIPIPPLEDMSESGITIMRWDQAKLILERVTRGKMPHIMEKSGEANKRYLVRTDLTIDQPLLAKVFWLALRPAIAIDRIDHGLSNVNGPDRMLKPPMRCTDVDQMGLSELVHTPEALASGMIAD